MPGPANREGTMRKQRMLIAAAALALVAVACGGDDVTPGGTGTTPPAGSPSTSPLNNKGTADATTATEDFEVELDNEGSENYFKPTFIKVKPGQVLKLELKNEGSNPHTFTITSLQINKEVASGQRDTVTVTFPAAGSADVGFFCSFHGSLGMRGAFFFGTAPQNSAGSPDGGSGTGSSDSY